MAKHSLWQTHETGYPRLKPVPDLHPHPDPIIENYCNEGIDFLSPHLKLLKVILKNKRHPKNKLPQIHEELHYRQNEISS